MHQYEGPELHGVPSSGWAGQGANILARWNPEKPEQSDVQLYVGGIWPESLAGDIVMGELLGYIGAIKLLMQTNLSGLEGWLLKNAHSLDQLSVQDWMKKGLGSPKDVIELVDMLCKVGFSAEAKDISMLWFVFYIASSGGLDMFSNVRFPSQGAQGYRMVKGAMSIADSLGDRLAAYDSDTIALGCQVRKVKFQDGDLPNLLSTSTGIYRAKRIVFALSPILADAIDVSPALPTERREMVEALSHGETVMVCIRFKQAFWRTASTPARDGQVNGTATPDINRYGLSGNALVIDGPIVWTMDNVSAEGANAMFAFVVTSAARNWSRVDPGWRQDDILNSLGVLYGHDNVKDNFISMEWHDWDQDEFSKGCPAAHFKPGGFARGMKQILLDFMPQYQDNQLFFASTEAASISNGYMSGAVWSGKKVAERVISSLKS